MSLKKIIVILISSLTCFFSISFAQTKLEVIDRQKSQSMLIESSNYGGSEIESLNIDILTNLIAKSPNSKGIIFVYCGKECRYGEVESHIRGINISLRGKGVDKKIISVLQGGFKEKLTIEYWLIPENDCTPLPASTIPIENVKFNGKNKKSFVHYDCCE